MAVRLKSESYTTHSHSSCEILRVDTWRMQNDSALSARILTSTPNPLFPVPSPPFKASSPYKTWAISSSTHPFSHFRIPSLQSIPKTGGWLSRRQWIKRNRQPQPRHQPRRWPSCLLNSMSDHIWMSRKRRIMWIDSISASIRHPSHCPLGMYVVPSTTSLLIWDGVLFVHRGMKLLFCIVSKLSFFW